MADKLPEIGVVAGSFDVLHYGYIKLFQQMHDSCNQPCILLHDDPTIERPEKIKPIHSVEERMEMIKACFPYAYVNFLIYNTEEELYFLLKSLRPDVRFMGDDYMGKDYTGKDLDIPVEWIDRSHGWSTTKYKTLIAQSVNER